MREIRVVIAMIYHPFMLIFIPLIILTPYILITAILDAIVRDIPSVSAEVLSLYALVIGGGLVYVAMRSRFFGKPYRKLTFLLPMLQMFIHTSMALNASVFILNKWAEDGEMTKGWAIMLASFAFIAIRLLVSLFYWKFPLAPKPHLDRTA